MKKTFAICLAVFPALFAAQSIQAQVLYSGSYSQNFDSLAASGTGNAWANNTTITGWNLFQYSGGAITTYVSADGSGNTGSFYSFGTTASTDRALGGEASAGTYFGTPGPVSGAVAGYIAVEFQNNTGDILDNFTISFDGEQWRNGGNASAQSMVLQYGFGSTFAGVTTWVTPGGSFNWASPVVGTTAAAVDGNNAGKVAGVGGTISSLTWNNGDDLWVRWIENNDVGNDHGLGIDNVSLSSVVAPVPEPGTLALATMGGLACLFAIRRKK